MKHVARNSAIEEKTATTWICILLGLIALAIAGASLAVDFGPDFNHSETGFPLDIKHSTLKCESCHQQGVFGGTPRRCDQCHSNTGRIKASSMPGTHIRVTGDCEYCHRPTYWKSVVKVDHIAVVGSCQSCHNGVTADGKDPGHITSGSNCDFCHRSFTWTGAVFDHSSASDNCYSCHNGNIADGKNSGHIRSFNSCEDCHRSISWTPLLRMDHNSVSGSCSSCHNGKIAEGKHRDHLRTTNSCRDCHRTFDWTPLLQMDHNEVLGGCFSCHNNVDAEGKHRRHVASPNNCSFCHGTNAWLPASFEHQSPKFPGDHRRNLDCKDCHVGNSQVVAWTNPAYQPECAGCHAGDFKSGPHKKHENPDTRYNVSELRDCSGSCHIYENSSLNRIKERRNREHRVTDREF